MVVFDYKAKESTEAEIHDKIGDICISMKSSDYLQLPERINLTVDVVLSASARGQYEEFEKKQVLALDDVDNISAVNAAALSNKLLQFAGGAIYDAEKEWHVVHNEKLEALSDIIESANGQPVLVFYSFKHDLARIGAKFKAFKPRTIKFRKT